MKLKVVLDSLEGLDEAIKALYVEKDGKFYLDVEGVTDHPQVAGLKSALEKEKKDAKDLKKERDELKTKVDGLPANFSQEEWDRLLALDGIDPNDPQAKEKRKQQQDERLAAQRNQYEQQINNLKTTHTTEIATLRTENDGLRSARAKDKAEIELDAAMDSANIDPKFRKAVKSMFINNLKHEYDGENISIFAETDLGPADVSSYIDTWSKSNEGQAFVRIPTGPDPKGGNGGTGSGNNPFLAANWNKTEQAALRSNPSQMNRLAQAAGFTDGNHGLGATKALK